MDMTGKKVAVLVTDGFEQSELVEPMRAITEAGGRAEIVSPKKEKVRGWKGQNWGDEFAVDTALPDADPRAYDGLLLPGGVMNPDKLRANPQAVDFVKAFVSAGKPVAAICHGPWILIDAQAVKGKKLTSYISIKRDLINAGADWIDERVVEDGVLITSRDPSDLPFFNSRIVEVFSEQPQRRRVS